MFLDIDWPVAGLHRRHQFSECTTPQGLTNNAEPRRYLVAGPDGNTIEAYNARIIGLTSVCSRKNTDTSDDDTVMTQYRTKL